MAGTLPKKLSDAVPILKDQGMDYLCGAGKAGVSVQYKSYIAGAGTDAILFVGDLALSDMHDALFEVVPINQTSAARPAVVSARTVKGFSITGQNASDVMTLIIVGRMKGQLG